MHSVNKVRRFAGNSAAHHRHYFNAGPSRFHGLATDSLQIDAVRCSLLAASRKRDATCRKTRNELSKRGSRLFGIIHIRRTIRVRSYDLAIRSVRPRVRLVSNALPHSGVRWQSPAFKGVPIQNFGIGLREALDHTPPPSPPPHTQTHTHTHRDKDNRIALRRRAQSSSAQPTAPPRPRLRIAQLR